MPIPLELFTMIGSGLLSGLMSIWSMSLKTKAASHTQMVEALAARGRLVQDAREHGAKDKQFSFTRRVLAITSVGAVIVLPKLAALLWPEIPVTVGYTEFKPGFWFFTEGKDVIRWVTANGLTITPLDTHFVSAVAGLYFGASVVRNA